MVYLFLVLLALLAAGIAVQTSTGSVHEASAYLGSDLGKTKIISGNEKPLYNNDNTNSSLPIPDQNQSSQSGSRTDKPGSYTDNSDSKNFTKTEIIPPQEKLQPKYTAPQPKYTMSLKLPSSTSSTSTPFHKHSAHFQSFNVSRDPQLERAIKHTVQPEFIPTPSTSAQFLKLNASSQVISSNKVRREPQLQDAIANADEANIQYNLGVHFHQSKQYQSARQHYNCATKLDPDQALYRSKLGDCLYELGNYEDAIESYIRAKDLIPDNVTIRCYMEGYNLYELGQYQDAYNSQTKAIELCCNIAAIYRSIAKCCEKLGDDKKAEEHTKAAKELDRQGADSYNLRGLCLYKLGNHESAKQDYEEALKLNPNGGLILNNMGFCLYRLGNYKDALEFYEKAIMYSHTDCLAEIHSKKGECFRMLGNYEAADKAYAEAIKLNHAKVTNYIKQGRSYYDSKQYDVAIKYYQDAATLYEETKTYYLKISKYMPSYYIFGLYNNYTPSYYDEACKAYKQAIYFKLIGMNLYHLIEESLKKLEKNEEAATAYNKAIEFAPRDDYLNLGICLDEWIKHEACPDKDDKKQEARAAFVKAIECYNEAIKSAPQEYKNYFCKGVAHLYLQLCSQPEQSSKEWRFALESFYDFKKFNIPYERFFHKDKNETINKNIDAALGVAEAVDDMIIRTEIQADIETIKDYEEAIKLNPKRSAIYHFQWGNYLYESGQNEAASKAYEAALKSYRACVGFYWPPNLKSFRGLQLYKLEQYEEACNAYRESIKLNSAKADIYHSIEACLKKLERNEEADAYYQESQTLNSENADSYYYIGNCLYKSGKYKEAAESYNEAIKINPTEAGTYLNLGACLERRINHEACPDKDDKKQEARKVLERAIICYNEAIAYNPQEYKNYFCKGVAHLYLQQLHSQSEQSWKEQQQLALKAFDDFKKFNENNAPYELFFNKDKNETINKNIDAALEGGNLEKAEAEDTAPTTTASSIGDIGMKIGSVGDIKLAGDVMDGWG